jgi:hypothetical protein
MSVNVRNLHSSLRCLIRHIAIVWQVGVASELE